MEPVTENMLADVGGHEHLPTSNRWKE